MFKAPHSRVSPQALGVRFKSSTNAQLVPIIIGRTLAAPKLIWKANLKKHNSSGKKGKSGKKGGGVTTFTADLDMLLGTSGFGRTRADQLTSQPLQSIFSIWSNKDKWPVNVGTWTGVVSGGAVTITHPGTLVSVFAVKVSLPYSVTFDDYLGFGAATYTGTYQKNLWNSQFYFYDEQSSTPHGGGTRSPYTYTQAPTTGGSATIAIDSGLNGKTVTVYFAYIGGSAGAVSETRLYSGGSGYAIGDTGYINAGNLNANYIVTAIGTGGVVTGFGMTSFGTGYAVSTGVATATGGSQPGSGSGLAITIKSITAASKLPLAQVKQAFESLLGNSGVTDQPTVYDDVGGVAGANVDLGAGNMAPNFKYETIGWGGVSPEGDANPADILSLVITGPHGCNLTSFLQTTGGPTTVLGDLSGMRDYCDAAGVWISAYMDQQINADQFIEDMADIANCAPFWSEGVLKFVPYSEVSAVGNGAIFTAPTAGGPIWNLSASDFVTEKGATPILIERNSQKDAKNILPIEFTDRSNDYAPNEVEVPEGQSLSEFGARRDSTKTYHYIHSVEIARIVGTPLVRRAAQVSRAVYKFKLSPRYIQMEPMDLLTITEPISGLNSAPARVKKVAVDADMNIAVEAEPYFYGANAPTTIDDVTPTSQVVYTNIDPGSCGTPVIFEPVPRLCSANKPELWFAVPSTSPNYGGCEVWVSLDGGSSYESLGRLFGNSTVGLTTGSFPAAADPDTTHDLPVNLAQSLGVLVSWPASVADSFVSLAYLSGGAGSIPYELIAYTTVDLTSANHYTLKATGAGNEIRRAVFSAPQVGSGVLHNSGTTFVDLNGALLKVPLDPQWIDKTLYFKFTAFNIFSTQEQDKADVSPVTYTPTGVAQGLLGSGAYTISPANPLSQAASTYVVAMAQTTATFSGLGVTTNYNARNFTVSDPGAGNTQQYWVTVYDPGLIGDTGAGATLNAYCDTNQTRWNTAGYVRIGSIVVSHTGSISGGGGGSASGAGLSALTVTDSGDHLTFTLSKTVGFIMLWRNGSFVDPSDYTFYGSSFKLSRVLGGSENLNAIGG